MYAMCPPSLGWGEKRPNKETAEVRLTGLYLRDCHQLVAEIFNVHCELCRLIKNPASEVEVP